MRPCATHQQTNFSANQPNRATTPPPSNQDKIETNESPSKITKSETCVLLCMIAGFTTGLVLFIIYAISEDKPYKYDPQANSGSNNDPSPTFSSTNPTTTNTIVTSTSTLNNDLFNTIYQTCIEQTRHILRSTTTSPNNFESHFPDRVKACIQEAVDAINSGS